MTHVGRRAAVAALIALALPLAGCGGAKPAAKQDPISVLRAAKQKFDSASSVELTLATTSRPTTGDAVLGATGTLTHQPAFSGKVKIFYSGFDAEIPVVAVGGKVYAKLPLTTSYATINPAEYGAPDPAEFADTSKGISALLLQLGGLKEAGQVRQGKDVLSTYTGTLPGTLVKQIIPSAAVTGTYQTTIGIGPDGRILSLEVTGDFFAASAPVTYDITFANYDKSVEITKP